ncbi:MAG: hypothetical protein HY097_01890 [Nitrospinae bacterium]|nr:hypothetical protein [Nitrospinota bacterium]
MDDKSAFWWGEQGQEIQRIPVGLIRYAPGPLLDNFWSNKRKTNITRLLIKGEFGSTIGLEVYSENGNSTGLKGNLFYDNKKLMNLSEILTDNDLDHEKIEDKLNSLNDWPKIYLSELGRKRLELKLKELLSNDYHYTETQDNLFLSTHDIARAIIGLVKNYSRIDNFLDDKLHLANRRVMLLHHIVEKSIYEGCSFAFSRGSSIFKDRPLTYEDVLCKAKELLWLSATLVTSRLDWYIKNGTQIVDDTNLLSLLSQRRKVTFCGHGGIKTDHTSKDLNIRDIHPSHYGRICIVETTEGKGVGLNLQLASMARIRYGGEIETSYKMPGDDIKWFSPLEEMVYGESRADKRLRISFFEPSDKEKNTMVHSHETELETITTSKKELPMDISFIQPYGPAALLIPFLEHCDGTRAMMGAKNMKQSLVPENPEEPVLQTGSEGVIGKFKIGINALVAYMPWNGFNFEDGIVCSESFAKKMTTIHQREIICKIYHEDRLLLQDNSPSWKPIGSSINSGNIIFKVKKISDKGSYTKDICSEYSGILTSINKISLMHPTVTRLDRKKPIEIYKAIITQKKPLCIGDKIMGRHGNKGVISIILPDDDMPKLPDGTPIEVILNPNGVISRMNLSQILETHWGWIVYNDAKRNPFIVKPFQCPNEEELQKILINIPDTDSTGKVNVSFKVGEEDVTRKVVVGLQYIMKLNHLAEDKLKIRKTGRYNILTGGAVKGKNGGQRIGEMEFWALRSFGVNSIISEVIKTKNSTDKKGSPVTSETLISLLKAMGVVIDIDSRAVSYRFAAAKEISSWGPPVEFAPPRPSSTTLLTCKLCQKPVIIGLCDTCNREITASVNKKGIIEGECSCRSKRPMWWKCDCGCVFAINRTITDGWTRKGILDPETFGKEGTDKYLKQFGYVELKIPVINPLYEIALSQNNDKKILRGQYKLESADISSPVEVLKERLADKLTKNDIKKITISNLPVIPLSFRDPGNNYNDLHNAYSRILEINEQLGKSKDNDKSKKLARSLQQAVYNLFWGSDKPDDRGIVGRIQGREGLLRAAMLARRVDYSARAVIVPHPDLHMDECILPSKMKVLFEHPAYKGVFSKKRVLIHRAATLHKYNILSFEVNRFWDNDTIGMPPLVCGLSDKVCNTMYQLKSFSTCRNSDLSMPPYLERLLVFLMSHK